MIGIKNVEQLNFQDYVNYVTNLDSKECLLQGQNEEKYHFIKVL